MIYGIGIDTASASRLEKSCQKQSFMQKVFGERERQMFALRKNNFETIAANFAAKEAFSKAVGTGIFTGNFDLNEVEALRKETGEPYFYFSGKAGALIREKNLKAHLSITHETGNSTAFVILELNQETENN